MDHRDGGLLTLEPLIDAVRAAVDRTSWVLSGLQKTTSHEFAGLWEGDATRSAYLFFHDPEGPDHASLDVYLDETSRGLTGNLALVVDLDELGRLGDASALLVRLGRLSAPALPEIYRTPLTLRFRLGGATDEPSRAEVEARFKVVIPKSSIAAGAGAIEAVTCDSVEAFGRILSHPELEALVGG